METKTGPGIGVVQRDVVDFPLFENSKQLLSSLTWPLIFAFTATQVVNYQLLCGS